MKGKSSIYLLSAVEDELDKELLLVFYTELGKKTNDLTSLQMMDICLSYLKVCRA